MKRFLLSEYQKQLWFEGKLKPESKAYNINFCYRLKGKINPILLKKSVYNAYKESGLLYLRLDETQSLPEFLIQEVNQFSWEFVIKDSASEPVEFFTEIFKQYSRPFNFGAEPLYRNLFIKNNDDDYFLCLTIHHLALDAISGRLLIQNIEAIYNNTPSKMNNLKLMQPADYQLNREDLKYWSDRLKDATSYIKLLEHSKHIPAFKSRRLHFTLTQEVSKQFSNFAHSQKNTLFLTVTGACLGLLHLYSQQEDLSIGYSINIRNADEKTALGFYINTLPLRIIIDPTKSFVEFIEEIKIIRTKDKQYQKIPISKVSSYMRQEQNFVEDKLFNVFINQSLSFSKNLELNDIESEHVHLTHIDPQYDLLISFDMLDNQLHFEFEYNLEKYDEVFIDSLKSSLITFCEECIYSPHLPIEELKITSSQQEETVLSYGIGEQKKLFQPLWVPSIIEKVVKTYPENTALIFENNKLPFQVLGTQIDCLASYIAAKNSLDPIVAICLPRSFELVVAIHSIQKAGKAYLPLDPSYPEDRLKYMVEHSQTKLIITTKEYKNIFVGSACSLLLIDEFDWDQSYDCQNFVGDAENLAYTIYTSGSTGVPKGISIPHKGLINRINWMQAAYPITPLDKVLHKTPYSFDVSVWELFWPLMVGASMVIAPPEIHKDPIQLSLYIDKHQITILHFVPSMLQAFLEFHKLGANQSLRHVFCSGEALSFSQIQRFYEYFPNTQLHNLYGPTEASIDVTYWDCQEKSDSATPPIGYPIQNMQCLILDKHQKIQPIGVPGELYLSGIGLAKEYINSPELTSKAFVHNSYASEGMSDYQKMYKTGDLARYLPTGAIEYLGRIDHQVKIRGFRIELEEIQNVLVTHPLVFNAIVITNDSKLIAYYQLDVSLLNSKTLDSEELREFLENFLPSFMIPHYFINVVSFPLTASGKIDRKKLLELLNHNTNLIEKTNDKIKSMPLIEQLDVSNNTVELLRSIWQETLKIPKERISLTDSFFKLGGDSILMLQVIAKAQKKGIHLTPSTFLKSPVLGSLIAQLNLPATLNPTQETEIRKKFILSPIQQWFFENIKEEENKFHQYFIVKVSENIDEKKLENAIAYLVEEQESLRLAYEKIAGIWHQYYLPEDIKTFTFKSFECEENIFFIRKQLIEKAFADTSLEQGKLLIIYLVQTPKDKFLFFACHHLVIDFISWGILLDRLTDVYQDLEGNIPIEKTAHTSFKAWTEALLVAAIQLTLSDEVSYWQTQCMQLESPVLVNESIVSSYDEINIDLKEVKCSLQDIQDILLASLSYSFKDKILNQEVVIEREGHGRETLPDQPIPIAGALGWFTTKFPTKYSLDHDSLNEHLSYVKDQNKRVPNHGIGYGILKYLGLPIVSKQLKNLSYISFNFLGKQSHFISENNPLFTKIIEPLKLAKASSIISPYEFDLNSIVIDETLNISLEFKSTIYGIASQEVISAFKLNLKTLLKKTESFPVTPFQKGLLAFSYENEGNNSYLLQWRMYLEGSVNVNLIQKACKNLLKKYEILRTVFDWDFSHNTATQKILSYSSKLVDWSIQDLRKMDDISQQQQITQYLKEDKKRGFKFAEEPLIRFCLFQFNSNSAELIITTHHLVMDGQSAHLVRKQLLENYAYLEKGESLLNQVQSFCPYVDYVNQQSIEESKSYWEHLLKGLTSTLLISEKFTAQTTYTEIKEKYLLSSKSSEILANENITLASFFNTALGIVISNDTHQSSACWGTIISLRPYQIEECDRLVGPCLSTIPVTADFSSHNLTILEQAKAIQEQLMESYQHSYLGMADISAHIPGMKLFDVLFSFQNYQKEKIVSPKSFNLKHLEVHVSSHFPLSIVFECDVNNLTVYARYNENSLDKTYVLKIIERMVNLYNNLDQIQMKALSTLSVTTNDEYSLIISLNNTIKPYATNLTLIDLFNQQANKTPDNSAIIEVDGHTITYKQLQNAASDVAHSLLKNNFSDAIIGIYLPRSSLSIAAFVGVLSSGCAVIALEVDFPLEKIEQICSQGSIRAIVTTAALAKNLKKLKIHIVTIHNEVFNKKINFNIPKISSKSLCLLNYTSGSSGTPKLVLTNHQSHVNRLIWLRDTYPLNQEDTCILKTRLCFAPAIREIFEPLIQGLSLFVLPEEATQDLELQLKIIKEQKITRIFLTPSFLSILSQNDSNLHFLQGVTHLEISGEPCSVSLLKNLQRSLPNARIYNRYGCTEIASMIYADLTTLDVDHLNYKQFCPVGKPAQNTCVYVVNTWLQPCGINVVGEILIGSDSQANGYTDQNVSELAFIKNPLISSLSPSAQATYYTPSVVFKTGDLGRILPSGMLEYLGRKDRMFKIRGFRVEPAEIEFYLQKHPDISKAVVVLEERSSEYSNLVAFITTQKDKIMEKSEIISFLREHLPTYMIPAIFIFINSIPLTASGKIDYQKLIHFSKDQEISEEEILTPTQQILKEVFKEVLKVKDLSMNDNFFDRGGNSLLSLKLIHFINQRLGVSIKIYELYQNPTVTLLEEFLNLGNQTQEPFSYIRINHQERTHKTIFMIPPAGGSPHAYKALEKYLLPEIGMIAFEAPYLISGLENQDDSISSIARYYVQKIKELQSQGPYIICGWSFGGTVAFEVANQLKQIGDIVSPLILIDPGFSVTSYANSEYEAKFSNESVLSIFKEQIKDANIDVREIEKISSRIYQDALLIKHYRPNNYNNDVVLIKPKIINESERNYAFEYNGLDFFVQGKIYLHHTEGNHMTMLTNYPQEIAKLINFYWNQHNETKNIAAR